MSRPLLLRCTALTCYTPHDPGFGVSAMKRRDFITLLGCAVAWPRAACAQQARKRPTIGYLGPTTPTVATQRAAAFVQRLHELGWVEGSTIAIEYRWAEGSSERAAEIAAEFVRLNVDVIVTSGVPPVVAAKQATSAIPIVFTVVSDPVGTGLVANLARPRGNVTGLSNQSSDAAGKRLELLREIVPDVRRLGVVGNIGNPDTALEMGELAVAARARGFDVASPEGYLARLPGVQGESAGALRSCRSACEHQSRPHPHFGNGGATAGDLQRQGVCRSGGPNILWAELS